LLLLLLAFLLPILILLGIWSSSAYRPRWQVVVARVDSDSFPREERASCAGPSNVLFWSALEVYAVFLLVLGLGLAYRTRNIPSKYSQGKWLALCLVNLLQVLLVLAPLQFMIGSTASPGAVYLLRACTIALSVALLLAFLFLPKLSLVHAQRLSWSGHNRASAAAAAGVGMSRMSSNVGGGISVLSDSGYGLNTGRSRVVGKPVHVPIIASSGTAGLQKSALSPPPRSESSDGASPLGMHRAVGVLGGPRVIAADVAGPVRYITAEEDESPIEEHQPHHQQEGGISSSSEPPRARSGPPGATVEPKQRKLLPLQAQAAAALRDLANSMEDGMSSLNLVHRVRAHNQEVDSHSSMPARSMGSPHSHSGSLASHVHGGADELAQLDLSTLTRGAAAAAAATAATAAIKTTASAASPVHGAFHQHVHVHLYRPGASHASGMPRNSSHGRLSSRRHGSVGELKRPEHSINEHAAGADDDDDGGEEIDREGSTRAVSFNLAAANANAVSAEAVAIRIAANVTTAAAAAAGEPDAAAAPAIAAHDRIEDSFSLRENSHLRDDRDRGAPGQMDEDNDAYDVSSDNAATQQMQQQQQQDPQPAAATRIPSPVGSDAV
jgi:hypothetical protein